jgi:hypothetical protein
MKTSFIMTEWFGLLMKVAPLVIGIICVLTAWIPLVIWYTIDILSMGICSMLTCCLGDLFVWLLSAAMFFGGIGLIIFGIVSKPKEVPLAPKAP